MELAGKEYLEADGVADVVRKTKRVTTYFYPSANHLARPSNLQHQLYKVMNQPPTTCNILQHFTQPSMNRFRWHKRIIHICDINNGAEERRDDGLYGESHIDYTD